MWLSEHQTPHDKPLLLSGVFELPALLNIHLLPPENRKDMVCILEVEQAQNSQAAL